MSADAQPTAVANGAAAPGGSEALPTDDECAFGREYCRRYRKRRLQGFDDGLLLAGELQRGTGAVSSNSNAVSFLAAAEAPLQWVAQQLPHPARGAIAPWLR